MMRLLVVVALSLALHLSLGWAWTLLAGIAGGLLSPLKGWLTAAAGVAVAWALLVGYNLASAPGPVGEMLSVVGSLFGNLPAALIVGLTVLIGAILGAAGGLVGSRLTVLVRPLSTAPSAHDRA